MVQKCKDGSIDLSPTPSVLHITAYWITKAYGSATAKKLLLALMANIQVIDCDHATALMATNSIIDDIEDALQYYTTLNFEMEYFISADKKLKKVAIPHLPVYTAEEFLNEF
ncbi:MAG: hypothetical protein ABI707_18445 [Ferruginibacter sp.]